jgi:histidyl-tRNA synthetase
MRLSMVANDLRAFGMRVELHLEDVRPKKVFTLAEKKGIGSVIFIGEDELKK